MLLCCDFGNTNAKFLCYSSEGKKIFRKTYSLSDINFNDFSAIDFKCSAISSVVPHVSREFATTLKKKFDIDPYIITYKSSFNLNINYNTPELLGIDRICAAEGAFALFKDEVLDTTVHQKDFLIVVDFGTATTINIVSGKGSFEGGLITPGVHTMINSLFSNTAQLPQIDIRDYLNFIGRDTKSSIASGILNSVVSLIDKTFNHLKHNMEAEDIYIYITGGNAKLIQPYIKFENKLIDDLVLAGVRSVYERNKIDR